MDDAGKEAGHVASGVALILPTARVETIAAKEASEGQAFDKDAIAVLTKATELFLATLGSQVKADGSTWSYNDVAKAVHEWELSKDMLGESNLVPLKVKASDLIAAGLLSLQ
jgi:hypothetical protein